MAAADEPARTVRPVGISLVGLLLLALGVILLLDRLEVLQAGPVLATWWPVVILAVGVRQLAVRQVTGGILVLLAGGLLLLSTTDVLDVDVGPLILPTLLVVLGLAILVASRRAAVTGTPGAVAVFGSSSLGGNADEIDGRTGYSVFGDLEVRIDDQGHPGQVVNVASITVFGDTKVRVPSHWRVRNRTVAVFGEVQNPEGEVADEDAATVELSGLVLFGDIKVRRGD